MREDSSAAYGELSVIDASSPLEGVLEGTSFGRYQLLELLGRGGMGEVWRARDTATDRIVAVKVLPAHLAQDRTFQQRFRREAHAAAQLTEPHVVPIHSYGEIDGRLYVDMRLIEGRDLQSILRDGPLNPGRAVMIVEQIAKALQAAHNVGLVHRDVKPSNILVAEYDFAYLIDFGIARGADQTGLTSANSMIGTWHYMAPERFGTEGADSRADVYALACVLHECLTGSPPFPGESLEQQIRGHLTLPPPRPSTAARGVPPTFDAVIARGMAKDTGQRYRTTLELASAARSAATTPVPRPPAPPPSEPPTQRLTAPPPTATGPVASTQWQSPTQRLEQMPTRRQPPVPPEPPSTYRAARPGDSGQPPPSGPVPSAAEESEPAKPSNKRRIALIGAVLSAIVLVVATTVLWVGADDKAGTQEIFLEQAAATGQNPFTPPATIPQPPPTKPGSDPAGAPAAGGEVRPTDGDEPGLYGGTRNLSSCDPEKMITYLAQNPDKARAWAGVFQITPEQIPAYIRDLTPIVLRTDTRVTNHGFQNGQATPFQSVLQAGTAVMVDKFGIPRVRCACGNPLLEPIAVSSAAYTNEKWAAFSPESLSLVRPSANPIETFVLYDPATGAYFGRPRGGTGANDIDDPRLAPAVAPPPPASAPAPPPPATRAPTYTGTRQSPAPAPSATEAPPPTTTWTPTTTTWTPTTTYPPTTTMAPTTTYTPPPTTYNPPTTTYAPTTTYEQTFVPPR